MSVLFVSRLVAVVVRAPSARSLHSRKMDAKTTVYLIAFCIYLSLSESTPTDTNSNGPSTSTSTKDTEQYELPPPVFPDDNNKYRIVPSDESMLRILSENGDKHAQASEMYDLLHSPQYVEQSPISPFKDSMSNSISGQYVNFKLQSELLQADREYVAKDDYGRRLSEHAGHVHSISGRIGYLTGTVAAATIGTLVIALIASYAGMVLWRKRKQSKYANREVLQNDEDSMLGDDRSLEII